MVSPAHFTIVLLVLQKSYYYIIDVLPLTVAVNSYWGLLTLTLKVCLNKRLFDMILT